MEAIFFSRTFFFVSDKGPHLSMCSVVMKIERQISPKLRALGKNWPGLEV
jgi:hypothetical protein